MSKKQDKENQNMEEKVITRYERKQQRRKEQEAREKRQKKINTTIGIAIAVVIIGFIASFPIRTLIAVNQTYIVVDNENITKVEFDYHYNTVFGNYYSQYGYYMSSFGVDLSGDLSKIMYSDTLTWQDYFDEMAVESIKQSKALMNKAEEAGFEVDTTEDLKEFEDSMKTYAAEEGTTLSKYLKLRYGSYATLGRLKDYVKENVITNAYYNQLLKEMAPGNEEIQSEYDENVNKYDSVNYRMIEVAAELPTEPTELADEQEVSEGTEEGAEGTVYQPSQAEIDAAMAEAKAKAEKELLNVATEGVLYEGKLYSSMSPSICDWLFDASRKAGDTAVMEEGAYNRYLVVAFEDRYLDETLSVNARVIVMNNGEGQAVYDEWMGGAATEESFIELYKNYNSVTTSVQDEEGLFENLKRSDMDETLAEWMFAAERQNGDTTMISIENDSDYMIYYIGAGEPEWKVSIKSSLLSTIMAEHMEEISSQISVEDPKGRLNYLKVQEAAAADTSEEADTPDGTDASQGTDTAEDTDDSVG